MVNNKLAMLLAAMSATISSHSYASTVTITDNAWHPFDVSPDLALSSGKEWIDISDGSALDFSFTLAAPTLLTVVDGGFAGDRFQVFDNGKSLGFTSAVANSYPNSVGLNFDTGLSSGNYSTATFLLGAGQHDLTGLLSLSALDNTNQDINATVGALRLQPVPLPGAALLLLSGGGLLGLIGRRRRLAVAGVALGLAGAGAAQAATTTVKIIGFNDFHGNLNSPGSFSGAPSGGADYLAGYIANLKSQNPYSVVVEAGDVIGASPLVSALFHDEGTIEALNRAGLNIASVGNHEFDEGSTELLRMQNGGCHPTDTNSCKGASVGTPVPFEGAKFKYFSANVTVTATGKTLFPPYIIKVFGGVRVGFIGMTLKDTPSIVTPTGVAGLSFSDEVATVNALVPKLRGLGVEAIVVVVHQGGFQGSDAPNFINDCSLTSGGVDNGSALAPLRGIVAGLDDAVDLVISGHTHTGYNCRLPTKNPNHLIPVTQASNYGRVLTDVNMTIDNTTGDVTAITANNIVVSRSNTAITPNAQVASIVAGYNTVVSPLANQVVATITGPATNSANAAGEMAAGDLIADAQLAATASAANGDAVIAFMNAGGVRMPGFVASSYPHDVTYSETFTVQPFGNSLVTMTLTAQQIKDVLEQQFVGCLGQTVQRVMQISNGFSYSWSASAAPCHKIVDVTLDGTPLVSSGVVLSPATTYRIECNNFMSTGGDGFTVFQQGQNQVGGAQDIDALVAYLSNFLAPNPPYDPTSPALHTPRITMVP